MSESSKKGPLIVKKTKSSTLERPKSLVINSENDFKFNNEQQDSPQSANHEFNKEGKDNSTPQFPEKRTEPPVLEPKPQRKMKSVVGKNNNVKSIKVPHDLHVQIGVLGKFMDENKTYAIISELVEYYAENELTDRQKKQFEYMTDFLDENNE